MNREWLDEAESVRYRQPVPREPVTAEGIERFLNHSDDFISGAVHFGGVQAKVFCIDGLVKDLLIDQNILGTLTSAPLFQNCKSEKKAVRLIEGGALPHASFKKAKTLLEAIDGILGANFVLLFEKEQCAFVFDVKGFESRSIEAPENESVVGGSKDGFSEPLRINTAIVRRHIRSHHLAVRQIEVGRESKTTLALVYLENVAEAKLVEEAASRLRGICAEGIVSPGQVEAALSGRGKSIMPGVLSTERADKLCANLYNGRVGVLTDGYPVAFIVPAGLAMFMQTPEDYATGAFYASFVRLIRYFCLAVNLFLPALYIAVANFSCEILPAKLAQAIMQAKFGMPFSTLTEVVLMLVAFEVLIEAGLRLPNGVGQAVSIVSGLIVGEAAVNAKLASPAVVMLTAIAGIASFVLPYQSLANACRTVRLALLFAAAAAGLPGLAVGTVVLLFLLNRLENLGLPFLAPFSTGSWKRFWKDTLIRRAYVSKKN